MIPVTQLCLLLPGNTKGGIIIVLLTSCLTGLECMTTDDFCFYLKNRLIQTSQTGGLQYSNTSPFSIPCYCHGYLYQISKHLVQLYLLSTVLQPLGCYAARVGSSLSYPGNSRQARYLSYSSEFTFFAYHSDPFSFDVRVILCFISN